LNSISRSKRVI